jgi:hypothetical protein
MPRSYSPAMFVITEADAAAIRAVFNQEGELSAAIELRRRFPGVTDNAKARACARSIAGWTPLPAQLAKHPTTGGNASFAEAVGKEWHGLGGSGGTDHLAFAPRW